MAEIINLKRARKARARTEAEKQASENRVSFGRTKADRDQKKQESARAKRVLDGHKIVGFPEKDGE